jgi:hypothetical protein
MPASQPTIRVSIGRIEVRAVQPPPEPATAPTATARYEPPMTLEAYLRRRNGGGR